MSNIDRKPEISRRDFLTMIGQAGIAGGFVLAAGEIASFAGRAQENTPPPDPYAEVDERNIAKMTAIDRREGQVELESPRILGYLEYREDIRFLPDKDKLRAVLADSNGEIYGFASNSECTIEIAKPYLQERVALGRTKEEFEVYFYPVGESEDFPYGLRVDGMVGRVRDDEELPLLEGEIKAPHYALDEVTVAGEILECPDFQDRAVELSEEIRETAGEIFEETKDITGDAIDKLQEWWSNR
jgi:hypothetical protein